MMALNLRLLRFIPLISSFCLHAQAQTSLTPIFQLGPVPASLEATVVTSYETMEGVGTTGVVTYSAACPSAISPENDACRDLSIYPVEVYHTQGSVFGGIITARAEERTTTWVCSLGDCETCIGSISARCRETIIGGGSTITSSRNISDGCSVRHASVPLVITAGAEKLQSISWKGMLTDASGYLSAWGEVLSSVGCPARQTLGFNTASTTSNLPTTSTSTPGSVSSTTSGQPSVTNTLTSILPSSSTASGSRNVGGRRGPVWILAGFSSILLQYHWA